MHYPKERQCLEGFHSCRKDKNHTHILQECHHDYNGNLVDTNTKKKVWSVCPFLLDGIYSSLCESVMRTTGNKKFKVFSHNISCMYMYKVESWKSGTFDALCGEMRNYVHTCLSTTTSCEFSK